MAKRAQSDKSPQADGGVRQSPPWVLVGDHQQVLSRGTRADAAAFLAERSKVHSLYIVEENQTKRLGMKIGATLVISAVAMMIIAPPGREVLSYWLGAALFIVAAGCVGYKRVWAKTKNNTIGATDGGEYDLRIIEEASVHGQLKDEGRGH